MKRIRVAVVGAGIGGLTAALELAARGLDVVVLERHAGPGGKMRRLRVGGREIDAGPTVLTMRWVFDEIFARAGASLDERVGLEPAGVLARHAWGPGERLDLHASLERSAAAVAEFAGAREAAAYRRFSARARAVYDALEPSFMSRPRPSLPRLVARLGLSGLTALARANPFASLARALARDFRDPRLRQLFGRYATYCGSSPYRAPAILMLIAHAERRGVWLVKGGMFRLAAALAGLAAERGAELRYGETVVDAERSRASGGAGGWSLELASGERLGADALVLNADGAALAQGLAGRELARAVAPAGATRSLSAVTWALLARPSGFPLSRHNVFFSRDYAAEFGDLFGRGRVPTEPTVYVCAQDRAGGSVPAGPEPLLCLVNAPAIRSAGEFTQGDVATIEHRMLATLARCGLELDPAPDAGAVTTPSDFEALFPGTGGALYGRALHGWSASFRRAGSRGRAPGIYLAGGSVHPGPGVPMVALSGRLAAAALLGDYGAAR